MAKRPKVGLLGLTLELYETLAPKLRADRDAFVRKTLKAGLAAHVDVIYNGGVFRREDIDAQVAGFEAAGADAIVVVLLSYSPSQLALPALSRTRLPVLIWNTQELLAVDENYGGKEMIANHGVHGTQDLANVLLRNGVKYEFITSHPADDRAFDEVADFVRAAAAVKRLRNARIGLMGYPFPGMGDFAVDTTQLAGQLGCQWISLNVPDYNQRAAAARPQAVSKLVAEYRTAYNVDADVKESDLQATARSEIAMRGLVKDHRLDAISYQFMAFGEDVNTETVPFVATCRLMSDGIGFGGEGDIVGAAGAALLHWLQPPASFSEIFTIDFAGNGLFMAHMGEANAAMHRTGEKIRLAARPGPITRTRAGQLELSVCLQPGPATFYALALGPGNRWRLIVSAVEIADYGPLASMIVPHFKLTVPDVRAWLTAYGKAGGPHHNAVCFGDARAKLRYAASLLGADYVEI